MSFEDDALKLFKNWLNNGVEALIIYDLDIEDFYNEY